jgi:hypothetical protein
MQKILRPERTAGFAKQNNWQQGKMRCRPAVPAGLVRLHRRPGVETPGYFRLRLWREKNLRQSAKSADAVRVQSVAEKLFWTFRNGVKFLRSIKIC